MKLVIVSDSHGSKDILDKIHLKEYDGDYFFHLGDAELPEYLLSPFVSVKGNCDFLSDFPNTRDIEIEGIKIHMEHGNNFMFNHSPGEYIKNQNCDIFLFGHTHIKLATKVGRTLLFNPGSVKKPRDGSKGSYLIINIDKNKNITHKFIEFDL